MAARSQVQCFPVTAAVHCLNTSSLLGHERDQQERSCAGSLLFALQSMMLLQSHGGSVTTRHAVSIAHRAINDNENQPTAGARSPAQSLPQKLRGVFCNTAYSLNSSESDQRRRSSIDHKCSLSSLKSSYEVLRSIPRHFTRRQRFGERPQGAISTAAISTRSPTQQPGSRTILG